MNKNKLLYLSFFFFGFIILPTLLFTMSKVNDGNIYSGVNLPPQLIINSPSSNAIIRQESFSLIVTTTDDDGTVARVFYTIKNNTFQSSENDLTYLSGDSYKAIINIENYTSGDYLITITSVDNLDSSDYKILPIRFAIVWEVIVPQEDVYYKNDDVEAKSSVRANCTVVNNILIQNLDLQIELDDEFSDADNYVIYRSQKQYTPIDTIEGVLSLYTFDEFQEIDIVYFDIETPTLESLPTPITPITDPDTQITTFFQTFSISSQHYFTNVHLDQSIDFRATLDYNWTLYRREGANFVELDTDEWKFSIYLDSVYSIVNVELTIPYINSGDTYEFKVEGVGIAVPPQDNSALLLGVITAIGLTAIAGIIIWTATEFTNIIKIGIIIGVFIISFIIVYLVSVFW